ncbi:hypothetical protein PGC08_02400 [Brevibacterium sp. BDJS002]|uniref:hypothetical protein n=1 Tax=Brevibacterium sp. BDJS002 TaxID=3020906 RepID=UPI0023074AC8|nr:hypothetical protein [Brevibacterium sp. BDJS002]WCE40574.1 hypothetical protein PGC08_02400 [Brevibacterium sp. BDJS002]
MKFIRRAFVSAIAAVALVVGPAVSAEAAGGSFDVTKLSAKSIVVSNSNCRNIDVNMSHKKSGVSEWMVDADVTRGGGVVDYAFFANDGNSKRTRVMVCPDWSGLGKYSLGPSEVIANNSSYSNFVDRTDYTKGSFYVRGKTYASLSTKRSGKTVSLTSKTKVYNPEKYGKVNYNPKVKFQVKSGSKWKTIKTVTANKGKATYKVKTKSKKSYRVTFSQVSWATGATSKSAKR